LKKAKHYERAERPSLLRHRYAELGVYYLSKKHFFGKSNSSFEIHRVGSGIAQGFFWHWLSVSGIWANKKSRKFAMDQLSDKARGQKKLDKYLNFLSSKRGNYRTEAYTYEELLKWIAHEQLLF